MFAQRSIDNRAWLPLFFFVTILAHVHTAAQAQIFSTLSVTEDAALTQQRVKDIADADIPDDPSVIFQDMRDALGSANQLTERSIPAIKQTIDKLGKDSSPSKSAIESLRQAAVNC